MFLQTVYIKSSLYFFLKGVTNMSEATLEKNVILLGGWSELRSVNSEDVAIFNKATEHLLGVDYTPLKVSTQVVAGMNYQFICDSKVVAPGTEPHKATVTIYQPLQGDPIVTNITIEHATINNMQYMAGGWSQWKQVDEETLQVFNEAMQGLVGVKYTPLEVSYQVVAGMNYKYKCNAQVVYLGTKPYVALVEIFKPLAQEGIEQTPIIMNIQKIS